MMPLLGGRRSIFRKISICGAANARGAALGAHFYHPSSDISICGAAKARGAALGAHFYHPSPVAAGAGKLFVCGWSKSGALGLGEDVTKAKVPTHVPTEGAVVSVACGKKFTIFATDDGRVFGMGDNSNGELGSPSSPKKQSSPVQVEGLDGVKIVHVSAGLHHSLAVSDKGELFSWGWGGSTMPGSTVGALGHGDTSHQPIPKRVEALQDVRITQVASGSKHSIALDADGAVYTWGVGEQGRLGHDNNTDLLIPTRVEETSSSLALPPMSLVRCGDHFSGCVDKEGNLYMWGKNKVGELGLEGMSVFAQESAPTVLEKDESFKGASVADLACGYQHCLALTTCGQVFVWGSAGFAFHSPHRVNQISAPDWPSERQVRRVYAGNGYSLVLTDDRKAMSWGKNKQMMEGFDYVGATHVLGHAKTASSWGEIVPRQVEDLSDVAAAACSHLHTAFIADASRQGDLGMGKIYFGLLRFRGLTSRWPLAIEDEEGEKAFIQFEEAGDPVNKGVITLVSDLRRSIQSSFLKS